MIHEDTHSAARLTMKHLRRLD
uniref:Uncharacterized protein n=1 Tax=Rhizophora mucronata TaxID=61149 RepID=A0A2P2P966_RHIMU